MRNRLDLPSTSYVIMGLLTMRDMSGYDLKWAMDRSFKHFYWAPAKSQIYAELRRLEGHNLVTMREVIQEQRPDKRIYSLTPEGHELVAEWLVNTREEPDRYKSAFTMKVFFGYLLPPERLLSLIGNRRQQLMEDIIIMEEKQRDMQTRLSEEESLLFPLLTLELRLASFYAELAWADKTLYRLQNWSANGLTPPLSLTRTTA